MFPLRGSFFFFKLKAHYLKPHIIVLLHFNTDETDFLWLYGMEYVAFCCSVLVKLNSILF